MTTPLRDQIGSALQAFLVAGVADVGGRVLVELDRALIASETPALAVQVGTMAPTYSGGADGGGNRPMHLDYEVLVDCIVDETPAGFRVRSKALSGAVRNALSRYRAIAPLNVIDLKLVRETPVKFPCEQGIQGGFTLSYVLTVLVLEGDQDTALS